MNRDDLKQILLDQQEMYLNLPAIERDVTLEDGVNYAFTGLRRSGKSYLMYQQIHQRVAGGTPADQIVYVNFEDERLLELTASDLNTLLEIATELSASYGKPELFLDEIQNIKGWEKFARRLADTQYRVSITGSNSRMLSSEIATTLGGRYMMHDVFPYSFSEYLKANDRLDLLSDRMTTTRRGELNHYFASYLRYGALPEIAFLQAKKDYLSSIYQTIYLGDIVARNAVANEFAMRLMIKKIAESVMRPLSYSRLTNILRSAGTSMGKDTVINYVNYIKNSYLLFQLENYAAKLVDKAVSPKYYFMDTGILGLFLLNPETAQLENLVAVELVRRYGYKEVFYFESAKTEVDFYIPQENLAVQVSYNPRASEETMNRELRAFSRLRRFMPGGANILITNSEEGIVNADEISVQILPAWKWMLHF